VAMKDSVGNPLRLDFLSGHLGWAIPGVNGGPLWWTTNAGKTWKAVTIGTGA